MARIPLPLDNISVASPCTAPWEEMHGDDRVRFCDQCQLNVYNLSAMTRQAAQQLVAEREGRLCVRFYRRPDDTVLTRDCPRGLEALRRSAWRAASAIFAGVAAMFFLTGSVVGMVWSDFSRGSGGPLARYNPVRVMQSWSRGAPPPGEDPPSEVMGSMPPAGQPVMGDVCPPDPNQGKLAPEMPDGK
jgi:hypothetical protein